MQAVTADNVNHFLYFWQLWGKYQLFYSSHTWNESLHLAVLCLWFFQVSSASTNNTLTAKNRIGMTSWQVLTDIFWNTVFYSGTQKYFSSLVLSRGGGANHALCSLIFAALEICCSWFSGIMCKTWWLCTSQVRLLRWQNRKIVCARCMCFCSS